MAWNVSIGASFGTVPFEYNFETLFSGFFLIMLLCMQWIQELLLK